MPDVTLPYEVEPVKMLDDQSTVDQVLEAALFFLKKYGWVRNRLGGQPMRAGNSPYGSIIGYAPACAVGAIEAVTNNVRNGGGMREKAIQALRDNGEIKTSIPTWNDSTARDSSDVIAKFRQAIEALRN